MGRKVKFSREVKFTPTWDGNAELPVDERFTVTLKVAPMEALLSMVSDMQEIGMSKDGVIDTEKLGKSSTQAILDTINELLPSYATVNDLEADDGPVTIGDVCSYGTFLPLAAEILAKLAEISSPTEADQKN